MSRNSQTTKPVALLLALGVVLLYCGAAVGQGRPSTRGIIDSSSTRLNHQEQKKEVPSLNLTFSIFTFPGTVGTFTSGINKAGHLVGEYTALAGDQHGFLLKSNKFTTIDFPGASFTQVNAINDGGLTVGSYSLTGSDQHGFMLSGKNYTSLDYPGSSQTAAFGINKSKQIVGLWLDANGNTRGFLFSKGAFTSLDVPGAAYTIAWGLNSTGDVVGWYGTTLYDSHGFLYHLGTYTTLDYPGFSQNYAADINDSGQIAGGYGEYVTVNGIQYQWEHCYVYENGQFNIFDAPFGPPVVTQVWHITDGGVMTGFYADNIATEYGFTVQVGP